MIEPVYSVGNDLEVTARAPFETTPAKSLAEGNAPMSVFWTLPTAFLSGAAAAAGIVVINSIGNLAGFAGPFAMGWIKDQTGSYAGDPLLLPVLGIIAIGILLIIGQDEVPERIAAAE